MPFKNEHSLRVNSPKKYVRFRRQNDKFGPGKDAIFGITKSGKAELQAVRFRKKSHTVKDVEEFNKKHKLHGTVHPAKESSDHMSAALAVNRMPTKNYKMEDVTYGESLKRG